MHFRKAHLHGYLLSFRVRQDTTRMPSDSSRKDCTVWKSKDSQTIMIYDLCIMNYALVFVLLQ